MADLERRRAPRFKLTDPVQYWWLAPSGSVQACQGMTQDIGIGGVMVVARRCPPKGVRVQMTIHVARHDGVESALTLHGEGIVVRVETGKATKPSQRSKGFAALMHFYSEMSNRSDNRDQVTAEL